jgi:hypothetical protein
MQLPLVNWIDFLYRTPNRKNGHCEKTVSRVETNLFFHGSSQCQRKTNGAQLIDLTVPMDEGTLAR